MINNETNQGESKVKLIITGGATREPLDGVRWITNFSTGRTAAVNAQEAVSRGWDVLYLHGIGAVQPDIFPGKGEQVGTLTCREFSDFASLNSLLKESLAEGSFHGVIHLAAVSDYSPKALVLKDGSRITPGVAGKISSDQDFSIEMVRNFKIISCLKSYSSGKLHVTGFKLTNTPSLAEREESVQKILKEGNLDLLVHNDLSQIDGDNHPARILSQQGIELSLVSNKGELAREIINALESDLGRA